VTTRVHPTSETRQATHRRPVVVGLDKRGRSASALVWAVDESERSGGRLQLLTAVAERKDTAGTVGTVGHHDLSTLARRMSLVEFDERTSVGTSVDVLLDAAAEARLLVIGCRRMSPAQRLVMGGTSRAVAAWSPVPVVIVPEAWIQPSMAYSPIVVGVRPSEMAAEDEEGPVDGAVLEFAFARASVLGAPLVVVSAYEPAWLQAWSPDDLARARSAHEATLADRLEPRRRTYPDVEVSTFNVAEPAGKALVEAARVAQLAVVGRHHSPWLTGTLGSTTRTVLQEVTCPVAVVPSGEQERLAREMAEKKGREGRSWGPMF
jgi:nucleotide-binding universal stress UspA family protein